MAISVCFVFLITLLPSFFFGQIDFSSLTLLHLIIFIVVVLLALSHNLLYYYSLCAEAVCDVEPFALMQYPFAIFLAFAIFPSERNIAVLVITLIASLALIISRIEKHHLNINKYFFAMLGFALLTSIEGVFIKILLEVFSPIALYSLRIGFLSLLLFVFMRPNFKKVGKKNNILIFGSAFLTVVNFVFYYYAISNIGIIKSSLIMILAPVMVLILSRLMLKENLTLKKAMADTVIVSCAIVAVFIG
ncbi:DMT family transporter [bacterium]|nr:DMT family transporter [bacterium]